ncbi:MULTISPECIES: ABC transporter permease [Actinotignum]|uniref:ABC transporter permease n=1 Tax=Actinotignum TaxID=1653174 RepID=UPI00254FBF99|nr:ABC transporter permease [Actinotignum schaalii]MDK7271448.1 ABC transporter permease [Actinotignum schaalii]
MLTRYRSIIRVSWASSVTFATVGTAVTTLLVLPLLDVLFDVVLGNDVGTPDLVRTGYAAALVALATSVASGVVSAVATDRALGIFQEVHLRRRFDVVYWVAVTTVPCFLAVSTGIAAIGAVFLLSPDKDALLLGRVALLAVAALVCGVLLGVAAAGIGVDLPDPYLGATLLATFLPVFTGVIVPLEYYPPVLAALANAVPLSGTIAGIAETAGWLVVRDIAVAATWAGVGVIATRHAVARLRSGIRRDVV